MTTPTTKRPRLNFDGEESKVRCWQCGHTTMRVLRCWDSGSSVFDKPKLSLMHVVLKCCDCLNAFDEFRALQ